MGGSGWLFALEYLKQKRLAALDAALVNHAFGACDDHAPPDPERCCVAMSRNVRAVVGVFDIADGSAIKASNFGDFFLSKLSVTALLLQHCAHSLKQLLSSTRPFFFMHDRSLSCYGDNIAKVKVHRQMCARQAQNEVR